MVEITQGIGVALFNGFNVNVGYWPKLVGDNENPSPIGVDAHAISKGCFLVDSFFTHAPHQTTLVLPGAGELKVMVGVAGKFGESLIQRRSSPGTEFHDFGDREQTVKMRLELWESKPVVH